MRKEVEDRTRRAELNALHEEENVRCVAEQVEAPKRKAQERAWRVRALNNFVRQEAGYKQQELLAKQLEVLSRANMMDREIPVQETFQEHIAPPSADSTP